MLEALARQLEGSGRCGPRTLPAAGSSARTGSSREYERVPGRCLRTCPSRQAPPRGRAAPPASFAALRARSMPCCSSAVAVAGFSTPRSPRSERGCARQRSSTTPFVQDDAFERMVRHVQTADCDAVLLTPAACGKPSAHPFETGSRRSSTRRSTRAHRRVPRPGDASRTAGTDRDQCSFASRGSRSTRATTSCSRHSVAWSHDDPPRVWCASARSRRSRRPGFAERLFANASAGSGLAERGVHRLSSRLRRFRGDCRRARALVHAARHESFGLVLLEAMYLGTPVITTAAEGPRRIVEDGVTGYVVPVGDSDALSRRMIDLIADPELARGWARRRGGGSAAVSAAGHVQRLRARLSRHRRRLPASSPTGRRLAELAELACAGSPAEPTLSREGLAAMWHALEHRGPDDEGSFVDEVERRGPRRPSLSIIDVPGGHQPIQNEDGTVTVVFNGEIYNYRSLREQLLRRGHRLATERTPRCSSTSTRTTAPSSSTRSRGCTRSRSGTRRAAARARARPLRREAALTTSSATGSSRSRRSSTRSSPAGRAAGSSSPRRSTSTSRSAT